MAKFFQCCAVTCVYRIIRLTHVELNVYWLIYSLYGTVNFLGDYQLSGDL